MIQITPKGVRVEVVLDAAGYSFPFTFAPYTEWSAQLLADHLNEKLHELVRDVRREEYKRGYKDGRGKHAKKARFSPRLVRGSA